MADYKVIHRAEGAEIPWEPGCPVALTAVQVSRNTETSEAWLQAKARSVSDVEAGSVYADLSLEYANGTAETLAAEFLDADVPAGAEQPLKPRKLPRGDVQSCSLTVKRVEGPNGTWESTGEASPLPSPEKLSLSPRAFSQRARAIGANAGDSVLHGKVQDHDGWWACACGQVNVQRGSCCSCGNPKERLMANEDEAALLAEAGKREEDTLAEAVELKERGTIDGLEKATDKLKSLENSETAAKLLTECENRLSELKSARKKHRTRIAAIVSAVAAASIAAAVVVTQVVIPAQEKAAEEARITGVKESFSNAQVGQTIEFGEYEQDNNESNGKEPIVWKVLAVTDDNVLLLSEKGLDIKTLGLTSYIGKKHSQLTKTVYESSEAFSWLQSDFMDEAFPNPNERELIKNNAFCLSEDQVNTYLSNSEDRICTLSEYARRQTARGASTLSWWLDSVEDVKLTWRERSESLTAIKVPVVNTYGQIDLWDISSSNAALVVRPAIYVKRH